MTLKQAIKKCKENIIKEMERNQLLEAKLWKKYAEQLEAIAVILKEIKIK